MDKYNILWADTPQNLNTLVNEAMERGEIPVGGIALQTFEERKQCGPTETVVTRNFRFCQATMSRLALVDCFVDAAEEFKHRQRILNLPPVLTVRKVKVKFPKRNRLKK